MVRSTHEQKESFEKAILRMMALKRSHRKSDFANDGYEGKPSKKRFCE